MNYSLYAIPAAWVGSIVTHFYAASLTLSSNDLRDFDNVAPRQFYAKCQAQEKQTPIVAKYLRAEAAQQNGFENIGLFGVAVLAGNFAGLPTDTLNFYSGAYLVSRALFTILYINTTSELWANLRSVVFVGGVGMCFTLIIKAGNLLNLK